MQLNIHDFSLTKNSFGRLILKKISPAIESSSEQTITDEVVTPIRAFPLSSPNKMIYLVNEQGHELAYIEKLSTLDHAFIQLILDDFATRELIPIIKKIKKVNRYESPCIWTVETDRGSTTLHLQDESNIRRFNINSFLVTDCYGVNFVIRNYLKFDQHSKSILDRFI